MKWSILIVLLTSCASVHQAKENHIEVIWNIIENASINGWSPKKLISKIGEPKQKIEKPTHDIYSAWIYSDRESGFQEWGISIKKDNTIGSITYLPKDPYRHEFTVNKIMARWKNLNCKHEKKQELSPGLVKIVTYVACDNNKRIVKYNRYKEVESILVKK